MASRIWSHRASMADLSPPPSRMMVSSLLIVTCAGQPAALATAFVHTHALSPLQRVGERMVSRDDAASRSQGHSLLTLSPSVKMPFLSHLKGHQAMRV